MVKSIPVASKRLGRPPSGGRDPGVHIRLPIEMIQKVDGLASEDGIGRSEAMRRLIEVGLSTRQVATRRASPKNAARAAELAAKVIDKHIDPAAPTEEREARKRKVLKGPSVFRGVRKD